jgi:hypothetical protein
MTYRHCFSEFYYKYLTNKFDNVKRLSLYLQYENDTANIKYNMEINLKYSIASRLASLPRQEQLEKRKLIKERLNVSGTMFSRYLYASMSQSLDFSGYQLLVIASILECSVDDLFSKESANVAPSVSAVK